MTSVGCFCTPFLNVLFQFVCVDPIAYYTRTLKMKIFDYNSFILQDFFLSFWQLKVINKRMFIAE
jgi:hypothetical protein